VPATSPDHTATYIAVGGTLGGVALAGLFALWQSRKQRAHERTLSDRADLRAVLAATLDALEAHHRAATSTLRATVANAAAARAAAVHALWEATERYNAATNSLRIRLGDEHPIVLVTLKLDAVHSALTKAGEGGDQAAFDEATQDRGSAIVEFVDAALVEVRSRTT
jgi:ribosomal protein S12 methylthiotransferase accessory factor YcaO